MPPILRAPITPSLVAEIQQRTKQDIIVVFYRSGRKAWASAAWGKLPEHIAEANVAEEIALRALNQEK